MIHLYSKSGLVLSLFFWEEIKVERMSNIPREENQPIKTGYHSDTGIAQMMSLLVYFHNYNDVILEDKGNEPYYLRFYKPFKTLMHSLIITHPDICKIDRFMNSTHFPYCLPR